MGQYYHGVVFSRGLTGMRVIEPWSYDNGAKLMEHSYVGNDVVNAMYNEILDTPKVVVWLGDYSDERYGDIWEKRISDDEFDHIFGKVWKEPGHYKKIEDYVVNLPTKHFLVNHSRKEYLDLADYQDSNPPDEYGFVIDPLPILTAAGNGRGGGDYDGSCMEYVGRWAFDRIEYTNDVNVERYSKLDIFFREKRTT